MIALLLLVALLVLILGVWGGIAINGFLWLLIVLAIILVLIAATTRMP